MDGATLQDRLYRAAGRSANIFGVTCDLFRPSGTENPLALPNRILRMPAAFVPQGGNLRRAVPQSDPIWEGLFDAAYTQPGDILSRSSDSAVFFIAAQQPLLPVTCVRALRMVSLKRPASAVIAGLNAYGGVVSSTDTPLATAWPASILSAVGSSTGQAGIEAELSGTAWQVLLPPSLNVALQTGDRITDDLGRLAVIANAELSDFGWRLLARPATT